VPTIAAVTRHASATTNIVSIADEPSWADGSGNGRMDSHRHALAGPLPDRPALTRSIGRSGLRAAEAASGVEVTSMAVTHDEDELRESAGTRDQAELREMALARIERKQEFYAHLLAYVLVNGMFVAIWAVTGAAFFWPIFPLLGWGIGIAFHAWDTFRRGEPSEARVQREMEHLRRG
jgi:hypothetical protein